MNRFGGSPAVLAKIDHHRSPTNFLSAPADDVSRLGLVTDPTTICFFQLWANFSLMGQGRQWGSQSFTYVAGQTVSRQEEPTR